MFNPSPIEILLSWYAPFKLLPTLRPVDVLFNKLRQLWPFCTGFLPHNLYIIYFSTYDFEPCGNAPKALLRCNELHLGLGSVLLALNKSYVSF